MATWVHPARTMRRERGLEIDRPRRGQRAGGGGDRLALAVERAERADAAGALRAALKRWRISPVVVVLPLVPVTPISVRRRPGWPYHALPSTSAARRLSRTTISGTPDCCGVSTTTAARPAARPRRPTNRCPSACDPRTATYSMPRRDGSAVHADAAGSSGRGGEPRPADRPGEARRALAPGQRHRRRITYSAHTDHGRARLGALAAGRQRPAHPPEPRRLTRNPRRWSASAASRTGRPATSGTGQGWRSTGCGPGMARRAPRAAGPQAPPAAGLAVGRVLSGGARRLRSMATRREASACCSIVRVTGAAVRPP